MRLHVFGIGALVALLISQLSGPFPSTSTATSTYTLDQATFSLTQSNSMLTFEIHDKDPLAIDKVLIDGITLKADQNGTYEYDMLQQIEVEVVLSSDSAGSLDKSDPMRHTASRTFPVRNLGLADAAFAQSASATRTRIRYQTFIGGKFVPAPIVCRGDYINLAGFTYFNGNDRSWDANSDSYKTRFDTIIAWGQSPSVSQEVSVGPTVVYWGLPWLAAPVKTQTASSQSMQLSTYTLSSDYVHYKISQNVANPFCADADGIRFGLNFYVRRDGVYTMAGNYLPVPHHEVYARDNSDPTWRQILREGTENFLCFTPVVSSSCDVDISQRGAF